MALTVLKKVYDRKQQGTGLTQKPAGPPPPSGFDSYKQSGGATGVLGMLQQILFDAKELEAEALHDEADAQKAYEGFVKESNDAEKEADKSYAHTEAENTQGELEALGNAAGDVHKSCDFTLKNFAVRQEARDQEVNALRQAKSILSGANFGAFLQQRV